MKPNTQNFADFLVEQSSSANAFLIGMHTNASPTMLRNHKRIFDRVFLCVISLAFVFFFQTLNGDLALS